MKRLFLLLLVAWLAGPSASHAQSPDALKALVDLAIDDGDKREAAVVALGSTRDPKVWLKPGDELVVSSPQLGELRTTIG